VEAKNFPNDNFEVFSYPNVHRDLPNYPKGVAVSSFSTVKTTFAGVPQAKGNFNVAYDIWLNGVGNGNGSTELMIWTETRPQTLQPLGTDQGDFTINGVGYRYTSGGINVVSYKGPLDGAVRHVRPQADHRGRGVARLRACQPPAELGRLRRRVPLHPRHRPLRRERLLAHHLLTVAAALRPRTCSRDPAP
jgi:hypothetical protein